MLHQANKYQDELNYVCIGYRVEPSQQRVGDGNSSRDPNAHSKGQVQDHAHGSSCISDILEVSASLQSLYEQNTQA